MQYDLFTPTPTPTPNQKQKQKQKPRKNSIQAEVEHSVSHRNMLSFMERNKGEKNHGNVKT